MDNKAENTKRLAKNTVYLYLRALFNLFISLYTSRLVLIALGVEDYGVYNAVGGFVSMFWLATGSLSTAVSRFLTFELGRNDMERMQKVFSLSITILFVMAVAVVILGETLGLWFLNDRLNIPDERDTAAFWVFQCSLMTLVSGFLVVPFNATIIAHERMGVYAYIGIGEAVFHLLAALFLVYGHYEMDHLVAYAVLWMVGTLAIQVIAAVFCLRNFKESHFRRLWDRQLFLEMFQFAGWNFVNSISGTFSGQGINIVLNIIFGPIINTARGLTNTVCNMVGIFVNNFTMAIRPQITKVYAAKDFGYLVFLIFRGTKFSFFILWFLALPLILEANFALGVWLVEYPPETVTFIRLSLMVSLIDIHYMMFMMAQHATGEIKKLQLYNSIITFLNFPFAYIFLKMGLPPYVIYLIAMVLSVFSGILTLSISKHYVDFSMKDVAVKLYLRDLLVMLVSSIAPVIVYKAVPENWGGFIAVGFTCVFSVGLSIYFIGCTQEERQFLLKQFNRLMSNVFHRA